MLGIKRYWDKGYAKRPLSICMLSNITRSLLFSQKIKYYVQILASTMLNVSFHALLRVGEYTAPTAIADSKILVTGVTVYRDQIWLKIMSPKTAKESFQTAVVHKTSLVHDPYELLVDYLKIRVAGTASLFTLQDGLSVTRTWFREHVFSSGEMYSLPKGLYATHSCRAGGATYLASKGLSDGELQKRGRWTSNTFLKYIRQLNDVDLLVMEATGGNVPQNVMKAVNLPPTSAVTPPPQHWINKYGMCTPPNKKLDLETLQKQKSYSKN